MVFKEQYVKTFLEKQSQLYDEPVAETLEEADEFLDISMATVCDNMKDVKSYLKEIGADICGMTLEDIEDMPEVFAMPDGKYLVLEV